MGATDPSEQEMASTTESRRVRNRAYGAGCLVAAVVAAVGGVVLLTGGRDEPDAAPAVTPPPVASSPVPSPVVSTPPKPEDVAAADAKARFLEYVRVKDRVGAGGYTDDKLYSAVAVSPARTQLALETRKGQGIRTTGTTVVATLGVNSVKLSNDPTKAFSEVGLAGCLDVQSVKALNADGTSAIAATRLPRIAVTAVMQMVPGSALKDNRPTGWYLSKLEYPGGGTPC